MSEPGSRPPLYWLRPDTRTLKPPREHMISKILLAIGAVIIVATLLLQALHCLTK